MKKAVFSLPSSFSMGDYSFYKMRGVDGTVIRSKGGATKSQIENNPAFQRVREANSEFGGSAKAAGNIFAGMRGVKHLADYNFIGTLLKLSRIIQKYDTISGPGQRIIELSKYKNILEGFNLNKTVLFDSIVTVSPSCNISREKISVSVDIPELYPGAGLINHWKLPLFRFIIEASIIPDTIFAHPQYEKTGSESNIYSDNLKTDWFSTSEKNAGMHLELPMFNNKGLFDSATIVVAIGIEFGTLISKMVIEPVKRTGCAKILAVS